MLQDDEIVHKLSQIVINYIWCLCKLNVTLDLNVYTCECHGPSLDLYMVAVLYSRLIYGISYRIRVVHFAENNSGTVRIHVESHTLYICRVVSWLELVVVNRDTFNYIWCYAFHLD